MSHRHHGASGHIELIIGAMFSFKSSTLLARMRRYTAAKLRCVILRYSNDNRYSNCKFSTHDKEMFDAVSVSNLTDLPDSFFDDKDVILIDEAQFQHPLVEFCEKHANQGRIVVVAALDSDADRNPFGEICDLVPKAEIVTKLNAVCMVCHVAAASFTKRLIASKAVELIGGADMYQARCRGCWDAPIPNTKDNVPPMETQDVNHLIPSDNNKMLVPEQTKFKADQSSSLTESPQSSSSISYHVSEVRTVSEPISTMSDEDVSDQSWS